MKGAINYLRTVRDICERNKGNCKRCPLGDKRRLEDNICPRLTDPRTWSDDFVNSMVRIKEVNADDN